MKHSGLIYEIIDDNIFCLIIEGKKEYFYIAKNLNKKFSKYLRSHVKVEFVSSDNKNLHHDILAYEVLRFEKISSPSKRHNFKLFYDANFIKDGIKKLINKQKYLLFIDFEMNMQDFVPISNFVQEIIEAGIVLTDYNGAIRYVNHFYIKPTAYKRLTKRTMQFLEYTKEVFNQAVPFSKLYSELESLKERYNPYVMVWGKSDVSQFIKCCEINKLKPLDLNFVNLLQLHINYYGLKESPGLFKTWEHYYDKKLPKQQHDSLEDATVTKEVFFKFKEFVNGE